MFLSRNVVLAQNRFDVIDLDYDFARGALQCQSYEVDAMESMSLDS